MKRTGVPTLLAGLIAFAAAGQSLATASQVGLIEVNGAIGPSTAAYISRAITEAAARQDLCLIIQLNTPGGLIDST